QSPEAARLSAEDISPSSNGPRDDDPDDPDDLFAEATEEVSLDSPERQPILSDGPSPAITPVTISPRVDVFDRSPDLVKHRDGMNAYMVYKVMTKTSLSIFSRDEVCVKRRFSDFLGLHSKLASKYMHMGYIVPPAPEKSIVGMTKVKVGKEDLSSVEFVEKRRSALERYLLRTVKHPALLKDPDVLQFLECSELPRAVSTQALSGAGILRMVNKAADAVNKMTIKMNESDAWFEEKQQQFENLDVQLRKLHASVESLVCHRKGNITNNNIKTCKVQQGERDFEQISKNIRREVGRFEKDRVKDFRVVIMKYLESLVHTQQQLIKYWEAFLPEAKAIA
uniref:Sorting nexin 2 n=1 Tax=Cyprinus carpio TaxID=7962 RepID=A0A8C1RHT5_CYPCA